MKLQDFLIKKRGYEWPDAVFCEAKFLLLVPLSYIEYRDIYYWLTHYKFFKRRYWLDWLRRCGTTSKEDVTCDE